MRNLFNVLLISILVTSCAAVAGRKEVAINGSLEGYDQHNDLKEIYISELLLVPFPNNLTTMSSVWPVAKFDVDSNGKFGGKVFVCGPIQASFLGALTEFYETNVDSVYIEIDAEKAAVRFDGKDFEAVQSDAVEEELYNDFVKIASAYDSLKEVPCYPDFE